VLVSGGLFLLNAGVRLFLIALTLLGATLISPSAEPPRPNIVFILADDLGINDLHCYGRQEHNTANLDRLASEGMRFTASYCAQPICSPSRAAILTGLAPARLHLTTYLPGRPDAPSQKLLHPKINQQLPLERVTLAEALKTNGYVTACVGKWHLGGRGFLPTDQGFDVYHPGDAVTKPSDTEGGKGEYDLTRAAMAFIETNRTRPFFLYLAHNSPHIPYAAKANLIAKNAKAFEPVYAAVIETLDDTVGLLLAKLDALGLRTNTIVIFTSDNGGLHVPEGPHKSITDNSPFRAGKGFLYEGGLRVPLIVRWPGHVPAGRVVDTPVINTDWFATLFDLAGLNAPQNLDALSFANVLSGGAFGTQRTAGFRRVRMQSLFWHFPHYTNQGSRPGGAVRDGDWKLIEHSDTGRAELYNLAADPREITDLASKEAERANDLRSRLHAWTAQVGAQTNAPNPNFDPALFKSLYEDVEPSRYEPVKASPATHERMLVWRKQMNAVLPK
jgi:arylsulfatase A-like enzyme